ncbi:MAG: hypothetical protein MJZ26_14030 [Fibrobacter sp.]|nr:hypothetical protein [Fibrobacter sp.]
MTLEDELRITLEEEFWMVLEEDFGTSLEDDESISTHVPLAQRRGFSLSTGLITRPSLPASHGISVPCCGGKLEPPFSLLALLALSSPHPRTNSDDATSKKHKCNFFILPPGNMKHMKVKLDFFHL